MSRPNLLGGPPETLLPADTAGADLAAATDRAQVAAVAGRYPSSCAAWATLAEAALLDGDAVTGYAFARTGYHRGLDQLRRAGWKGHGPVPWQHEPNRGFLRALAALARAAAAIGEDDEAERCQVFLADSSAAAAALLLDG